MNVSTAHLFFEQSGTFKRQFKSLGIPAYDYDIQNEYGETDRVIDLFREIDAAFTTLFATKYWDAATRMKDN